MFRKIITFIIIAAFLLNASPGISLANITQQALRPAAFAEDEAIDGRLPANLGKYAQLYEEAADICDEMARDEKNKKFWNPAKKKFWLAMLRKHLGKLIGRIPDDPKIDPAGQFNPTSFLHDEEIVDLDDLMVDYEIDIQLNTEYVDAAKSVAVHRYLLLGGQGKKLKRNEYVREMHQLLKKFVNELGITQWYQHVNSSEEVKIATKATDICHIITVRGRHYPLSVAEAGLLRLVKEAKANDYGKITLHIVVSTGDEPSKPQCERLLDQPYLEDVRDPNKPKQSQWKSYRDVIKDEGINIVWHYAAQYPYLFRDEDARSSWRVLAGDANASHGERGHEVFTDMYNDPLPKVPTVTTVWNGEDSNAGVPPGIIGWMKKKGVPMVMLTTTRTRADYKGGIMGIIRDVKNGVRVAIQELKTARSNGEEGRFKLIGLSIARARRKVKTGRPGRQPFNTNIIAVDNNVVGPILKELGEIISEDALSEVYAPDVIIDNEVEWPGHEGKFTQLEGPMGTCLINLASFLLTVDTNPRLTPDEREKIKQMLVNNKIDEKGILRLVNVPRRYFAPTKYAIDHWVRRCTDHGFMATKSWMFEMSAGSREEPLIELESPTSPGYYEDYTHCKKALGANVSVRGLQTLRVKGLVEAGDVKPIYTGHVEIITDRRKPVTLKELAEECKLPLRRSHGGKQRVEFKNVRIIVPYKGKPIMIPWDGTPVVRPLEEILEGVDIPERRALPPDEAIDHIYRIAREVIDEIYADYMVTQCGWRNWTRRDEAKLQAIDGCNPIGRNSRARVKARVEEHLQLNEVINRLIEHKGLRTVFVFCNPRDGTDYAEDHPYTRSLCLTGQDEQVTLTGFLPGDRERMWTDERQELNFTAALGLNDEVSPTLSNAALTMKVFRKPNTAQDLNTPYDLEKLAKACIEANPEALVLVAKRDQDGNFKLARAKAEEPYLVPAGFEIPRDRMLTPEAARTLILGWLREYTSVPDEFAEIAVGLRRWPIAVPGEESPVGTDNYWRAVRRVDQIRLWYQMLQKLRENPGLKGVVAIHDSYGHYRRPGTSDRSVSDVMFLVRNEGSVDKARFAFVVKLAEERDTTVNERWHYTDSERNYAHLLGLPEEDSPELLGRVTLNGLVFLDRKAGRSFPINELVEAFREDESNAGIETFGVIRNAKGELILCSPEEPIAEKQPSVLANNEIINRVVAHLRGTRPDIPESFISDIMHRHMNRHGDLAVISSERVIRRFVHQTTMIYDAHKEYLNNVQLESPGSGHAKRKRVIVEHNQYEGTGAAVVPGDLTDVSEVIAIIPDSTGEVAKMLAAIAVADGNLLTGNSDPCWTFPLGTTEDGKPIMVLVAEFKKSNEYLDAHPDAQHRFTENDFEQLAVAFYRVANIQMFTKEVDGDDEAHLVPMNINSDNAMHNLPLQRLSVGEVYQFIIKTFHLPEKFIKFIVNLRFNSLHMTMRNLGSGTSLESSMTRMSDEAFLIHRLIDVIDKTPGLEKAILIHNIFEGNEREDANVTQVTYLGIDSDGDCIVPFTREHQGRLRHLIETYIHINITKMLAITTDRRLENCMLTIQLFTGEPGTPNNDKDFLASEYKDRNQDARVFVVDRDEAGKPIIREVLDREDAGEAAEALQRVNRAIEQAA